MYLSIGNDMAVRASSIIGIFDLDNTSTSKRTREFLEKNQSVVCEELKGVETGNVLRSCNGCIKDAVILAGKILYGEE